MRQECLFPILSLEWKETWELRQAKNDSSSLSVGENKNDSPLVLSKRKNSEGKPNCLLEDERVEIKCLLVFRKSRYKHHMRYVHMELCSV